MWTYGYGADTDEAHRIKMESIIDSLDSESAKWYAKSVLSRHPKMAPWDRLNRELRVLSLSPPRIGSLGSGA